MPDFDTFQERLDGIQFIRQKTLDGDWITVHGVIDTLASEIAYIPVTGKTFFLYSAKIIITGHITPASNLAPTSTVITKNLVEASLKVDNIVKDTTDLGVSSVAATAAGGVYTSNNTYGQTGDGRFDVQGLSLIGNGIKKITIENTLDDGIADAFLAGWIENT